MNAARVLSFSKRVTHKSLIAELISGYNPTTVRSPSSASNLDLAHYLTRKCKVVIICHVTNHIEYALWTELVMFSCGVHIIAVNNNLFSDIHSMVGLQRRHASF